MENNPRRVMCEKGSTHQTITSSRLKTVTIIACGIASGADFRHIIVFLASDRFRIFFTEATPCAAGTVTESSWSNSLVFIDYLERHFLAHVSTKEHSVLSVLILFDGHMSHVNLNLSAWEEKKNFVFVVLPPQTFHITQPRYVVCFGPLNMFITVKAKPT